ncbi:MAG: ribosome maturation factor RimM [Actinobacteria bacterium]|nr:ribosome maturation factor RimM [Actinomycetota bacterium]MCL6095030.1 ribosome maturation factor RimM [Actinomycetota bacterium]
MNKLFLGADHLGTQASPTAERFEVQGTSFNIVRMSGESEQLLEVGKVLRPHGLRGEVVVYLWTNRLERVSPGAVLFSPVQEELVVATSRPYKKDRFIVGFEGVNDRDTAERLQGQVLSARPIDDHTTFWIHELVGKMVSEQGEEPVGTVVAVEANPASDLLVLDSGKLIPLHFVVEVSSEIILGELPRGLLD